MKFNDSNSIEDLFSRIEGSSISVIANFDKSELDSEDIANIDKEIPILPLRNMLHYFL